MKKDEYLLNFSYFLFFLLILNFFFLMVIYTRFDCEVLSRLSSFSVLEWYFIDTMNLSRHIWDFSLFMADIYWAMDLMGGSPGELSEELVT